MNQVTTGSGDPASVDRPLTLSRILFWVGLLIIPTILIIQVLVYQPFFNHFNDGSLLRLIQANTGLSSIWQLVTYGGAGYGYSGARASGWILLYPQYEIANELGPLPLFLINILLVCLIFFLFGTAFKRLSGLPRTSILVCFLVALSWPYTYDLIFFPSLEEKSVLLGAGVTMMGLSFFPSRSAMGFYLLAFIGIAIGTNSKTQYAFFLLGLIFASLVLYFAHPRTKKTRQRLLLFLALSTISLAIMAYQALFGSYNAGTRTGLTWSVFSSRPIQLICTLTILYLVYLIYQSANRTLKPISVVPVIWMATFLVGLVVWGFRTYFLTVFGVMFGSAVAVVVGNLKSVRLQQLATGGFIVVAVGWTLFRIPQVFEPLHGIGAFTQGQIAKQLAEEGAVIYTSCVEGSGHFNYYTERKWGITPEFSPLAGDGAGYRFGIPDDGQYVFGDRRLCSAPSEVSAWNVVWESPGDDGFRLYKRPIS